MGRRARLIGTAVALAMLALAPAGEARVLRISMGGVPETLDPILEQEIFSSDVIDQMYEGLTGITPDGDVEPVLASSWTVSPDNLSISFVLRPGVKFHSGRPVTSADVRWTYEQLLAAGSRAGIGAHFLAKVVGADDLRSGRTTSLAGFAELAEDRFEIRFTEPDALFPIYRIRIMDRTLGQAGPDWSATRSGGTGPFRFAGRGAQGTIRLEPFTGHWRGAPYLEAIEYVVQANPAEAITLFRQGRLDLVNLPRSANREIMADSLLRSRMISGAAAQVIELMMNQELYPPFRDKRVREAIALTISQEAVLKQLSGGFGLVLAGYVPPGFPGGDPSIARSPYDPVLARSLLAQAGYARGFGLPKLELAGMGVDKAELDFYAAELVRILSMPVTVTILPRDTFLAAARSRKLAFFSSSWTADYPDAATFLRDQWWSKSPLNRSGYANPRFDDVIEQAMATPDTRRRYALYHAGERLLAADHAMVPLGVRQQLALKAPDLSGLRLTAFRLGSLREAAFD